MHVSQNVSLFMKRGTLKEVLTSHIKKNTDKNMRTKLITIFCIVQ